MCVLCTIETATIEAPPHRCVYYVLLKLLLLKLPPIDETLVWICTIETGVDPSNLDNSYPLVVKEQRPDGVNEVSLFQVSNSTQAWYLGHQQLSP